MAQRLTQMKAAGFAFLQEPKMLVFQTRNLAASGITRKNQQDIQQFIEGGMEEDASDSDEGTEDDDCISGTNEENIEGVDSLHLLDQEQPTLCCSEADKQHCEAGQSNGPDTWNTSDEDDQSGDENDTRPVKSFNKQRKYAVSAAHRGRKNVAFGNSYKDMGGRSTYNSKIKKQLCSW